MYLVISLLIMAGVTYLIRVLPLTLFKREVRSIYLKSFLYYVPYAVLAAMTFPHIFYATNNPIYAILGTVVALVLGYCERGLTTVAVVSVLVVFVCNLIG